MLSQERLNAYRRMTPQQKIDEFKALVDLAWEILRHRPKEHVDRVFDLIGKEREESSLSFLRYLRRAR